jgi:hypothetical protein
VTAEYGTEGVSYTLTNTGSQVGYVTKLQARGRGVYVYDPITLMVEDTASRSKIGSRPLTLDLPYQRSLETTQSFANLFLSQYKAPRLTTSQITFLANRNEEMMVMALEMGPGRRAHVSERVSGIDEDFFINGVDMKIINQLLYCTWYTKSASYNFGAFCLLDTAGRAELDQTAVIGY